MYYLTFNAYCGMQTFKESFTDREEARRTAALILAGRRKDFVCSTLKVGEEWEVQEPEGSFMVPDACGILHLQHRTIACRECGSPSETIEAARECCYSS